MKVINYGHSCFSLISDDISIFFDPYQDNSVPGLKLPSDLKGNFVFCSHDHFDHNAKEKIKIINTKNILNFFEIIVPHDDCNGSKRGMNKIVAVNIEDKLVVHLGDIGCIPNDLSNIDKIKNADIVFVPINGFYTIGAKQAKELLDYLNPKNIIPMHYFKENEKSGYPDGNQIDIFKSIYKDYIEVEDSYEFDSSNKVVIFKSHKI